MSQKIKANFKFKDDKVFKKVSKSLRFKEHRKIIMKSIRQAARIVVKAQRANLKSSRKEATRARPYGTNRLSKSIGVITKRNALWVKVGARISSKYFGFHGRWVSDGLDTSDRKRDDGSSTGNMGSGNKFVEKAWSSSAPQVKATLGNQLIANLNKYMMGKL